MGKIIFKVIFLKFIKNITIVFFLVSFLIALTGCEDNYNKELKDKAISELGYINIKILDMLNSLNNLTFENYTIISNKVKLNESAQKQQSQEGSNDNGESGNQANNNESGAQNQSQKQETKSQDLINTTEMITDSVLGQNRKNIKWDVIKPEIELLNESWSIVVLDLYSLNVDSNKILDFSSKINNAMIAIKKEDKQASLIALADMYESLPVFLKEINADLNLQRIRQTQSYVINAYSLVENITNPEINTNLQKAIDVYSEVISDIDYTKDKTYKTNKIYVLLNELANSLSSQDTDIFYVKYKNFMEAINEI